MPMPTASCSVYACQDAATFMLFHEDEQPMPNNLPVDCLCTQHWLQMRLFDAERAYRYVSIRYALTDLEEPAVKTS